MTVLSAAANGPDLVNLSLGNAALYAVLGYATVFLGIVFLMIVVMVLGKIFSLADKKKAAEAPAPAPVAEPTPAPEAPGAAGQLKLHDVEPKTAAMLMAIVADKMGKPINELRFISIKEVK